LKSSGLTPRSLRSAGSALVGSGGLAGAALRLMVQRAARLEQVIGLFVMPSIRRQKAALLEFGLQTGCNEIERKAI
jgi:hypothetical protein